MKKFPRQPKRAASTRGEVSTGKNSSTSKEMLRLQFCFFVSGAAGLIYQVVWTKQLGQLFGYSAYAVATALAGFMGGMALGSALFGGWRPANRSGVTLYVWMEFGIAATALLSLAGIPVVREIYLASHPYLKGSAFTLLALRFAGAVIVLGLPTILMGGTLPVLLAAVVRRAGELGVQAGRFYAVNTAGAVVGTLTAGFVLIPSVGLRMTLLIAVALNLLAGALAWKIGRPTAAEPVSSEVRPPKPAAGGLLQSVYLGCFALVGATAIAYEIGWTRLLATPLGSSTYAFSLMLGTFLLGITVGSFVFEKWFRRKRSATSGLFAGTQLATGAAVLISLWLYREVPELVLAILRRGGGEFSGLLFAQATACGLALLPATILFGFNFPAVLALLSQAGVEDELTVSSNVGRAVAANTGGAIAAAVLCGFLVMPRIGSFRLIAGAACVNVAIGIVLFLRANARNWKPLALAVTLLAAIVWTSLSPTFFSQATAAFGVVLYRDFHNSALTAREMANTEDVTFFKDGINATIAVTRSENYVALKTNGKVDASNLDSSTQILLGDLGAVFHPNPRRVLIIGFGGGMTASAVSRFPEVERIDCVEIEPAVLQATSQLERLHRGIIHDPRLHVYFDDARNFLQTSRERYDLIISEPSNPWIAGIASLYTTEFFHVVRDHLAPGGNFVQWIQAYGLSGDDFAMVIATMQPHFRDMTLWHSAGRDFLVLARNSAEPLSLDRARTLWPNPQLRLDFEALHLTQPESWPAYFRLGSNDLAKFSGPSVNSDDRTLLEYTAPRHLLRASLTADLADRIRSFEHHPFSESFRSEDATQLGIAAGSTALEINSNQADRFLQAASGNSPELAVLRARLKLKNDNASEAEQDLGPIVSSVANQSTAQYWLGIAQRRLGLLSLAASTMGEFLRNNPASVPGWRATADIESDLKDWPAAVEAQTRLVSLRSGSAGEQCRLGDMLLRSRRIGEAEVPLRNGLRLDPYAFLCHRELGELKRATGRTAEAIKELEWVVRYFPEADVKTYISLALAYQTDGDKSKAEAALSKGRRLFPNDPLVRDFRLK